MCGICGIIEPSGTRVSESRLKQMADRIAHRGPDDEGLLTRGNVGLAFRRLSIIDLEGGHQPMANEDGAVWVVFNGEIYNFKDLRKSLEGCGHVFKTNADSEVLVHGWEEWGTDLVQHLQGMFAFAIWDSRQKLIFLARDRLGIKPLYYAQTQDRLVFGSELKSLLVHDEINTRMDWATFGNYLRYGYAVCPGTFYSGIRSLPPAHYMVLDLVKGKIGVPQRYWDLEYCIDHSKSDDQFAKELRALLTKAVSSHLVADVPIGVFLSGGLDSSMLVACMAGLIGGDKTRSFSIGFDEAEISELPMARLVAEKYKTDHREKIVASNAVEMAEKVLGLYDEPFSDATSIAYSQLCKLARESVTVALGGDGGDELFGGYNKYNTALGYSRFDFIPASWRRPMFGALESVWPDHMKGYGLISRLSLEPAQRFLSIYGVFPEFTWDRFLNGDTLRQLRSMDDGDQPCRLYNDRGDLDPVTRMGFVDARSYMVDCILRRVDVVSMSVGLEVRVPVLDHKIAEFSGTIPGKWKVNNGELKYIWRKAARPLLPPALFSHKKQGFLAPYRQWFKGPLYSHLKNELVEDPGSLQEIFRIDALRELLERHRAGSRDLSTQIWAVYVFKKWQDGLSGGFA